MVASASITSPELHRHRYAPRVRLQGTVKAIEHGDVHAETEVVVQIGSVNVIVTKKRKPYHH